MKHYEISCEGHDIYSGLNDISCYEPIALMNQIKVIASDYNHLPPACWSTFWKSTFKQHLDCRFDIMDNRSSFFLYFDICNCICLDTSYHFGALWSLHLKLCSLFFQVLDPVLTFSTDVVLILSIWLQGKSFISGIINTLYVKSMTRYNVN